MSREPVPATLVADLFQDGKQPRPGDFAFYTRSQGGDPAGLHYCCPCGCGSLGGVNFDPSSRGPCWAWDGNREQPTVTPSIRRIGGCKFHGFLTAGAFTFCEDSGG